MRLIVLPALKQIPLDHVVYPRQWIAIQVLLKLCQILILYLHIYQVFLVVRVLSIRRQLVVLDSLLISRAVVQWGNKGLEFHHELSKQRVYGANEVLSLSLLHCYTVVLFHAAEPLV